MHVGSRRTSYAAVPEEKELIMRPSNLRASNWSGTVVRAMLTVALGVTAAAIVRGDIPSGMDGTITACYRANSTQQGSLRVLDGS